MNHEKKAEPIVISQAAAEDVSVLAEYRFAMFAEMYLETDYSGIRQKFLEAARRYYDDRINSRDETSVVARRGGEPVACGTIMFQRRPPHVKNLSNIYGYILNIYVRPEFRKQGVATAVMRALEAEARRRGVQRIGLHASDAGRSVYMKLGYVTKERYLEAEIRP